MDIYTLLITLNIILAVDVVFTFIISESTDSLISREWRISFLSLFMGFLLLQMQARVAPFFSIVLGNYFVFLGIYFQVCAAVNFEYQRRTRIKGLLSVLSLIYALSYLYYTYFDFNTSIRIIIISAFLTLFYGTGVFMLGHHHKKNKIFPMKTKEIFILFIFSALFYLIRLGVTIQGLGAVNSLFEKNVITTASLLFVILGSQVYLSGLFHAALRHKNLLVTKEKEKLGYLFNFLNDTARYLDLDELYNTIEKTLQNSLGVDTAAIYLVDESRENHSMAYMFNAMNLPLDEVKTLKRGEGVSGEAIDNDRIVELNVDEYPNKKVARLYREMGVKKFVSIPLKSSEGILGAITMVYTESNTAQVLDRDFFYYLGEQIGLVLHNAFLFAKLKEMAHTDPLTGLYNRRKMLELCKDEIKRVKRSAQSFTIAMADLDHFKKTNDKYGHECGDEVLKASADLFQKECREYDCICRWGGEEFLFLLIDTEISAAEKTAERIRKAFEKSKPSCLLGEKITISIGLTEYKPDLSLEQLINLADEALYSAKENGRNRIMVK